MQCGPMSPAEKRISFLMRQGHEYLLRTTSKCHSCSPEFAVQRSIYSPEASLLLYETQKSRLMQYRQEQKAKTFEWSARVGTLILPEP